MDPQRLLAMCHVHAGAESRGDVDRVLATMRSEPPFEFFPLRRAMAGRTIVERFNREQFPRFATLVRGSQVGGEWANKVAALQEYVIDTVGPDGVGDSGLLAGERLYCGEGFVRARLSPLFDDLRPTP